MSGLLQVSSVMTQDSDGRHAETYDLSWAPLLAREAAKPYWARLRQSVQSDRLQGPVYPPRGQVLAALRTPLESVKVVILGQDPYHGPGQAHGLAFSVPDGVRPPPSLKPVLRELREDFGSQIPQTEALLAEYAKLCIRRNWLETTGNLTPWTKRGVLLLNTVLTVRGGVPKSHAGVGWEIFTDAVCREVLEQPRPIVWMLWGADARKKLERLIDARLESSGEYEDAHHGCSDVTVVHNAHLFLTAGHPSPLNKSVPYAGCRHFSQANDWLRQHGTEPVDWSL